MIRTSRTLWKDARESQNFDVAEHPFVPQVAAVGQTAMDWAETWHDQPAAEPVYDQPAIGDEPHHPRAAPAARADPPQRAPQDPDAARLHHRPGMSNIIPARVVDMSATGAKMELTPLGRSSGIPMGDLPNQFNLVMRVDRMEVDCEMIWQVDWLIGIRFLSVPRPTHERM